MSPCAAPRVETHEAGHATGGRSMTPELVNLLKNLPDASNGELVDVLTQTPALRIERIISEGQSSPPGFWYEQDEDEWVLLLAGNACLEWADGSTTALASGDALLIPARTRHRVAMTSSPAVWLAVFWKPAP